MTPGPGPPVTGRTGSGAPRGDRGGWGRIGVGRRYWTRAVPPARIWRPESGAGTEVVRHLGWTSGEGRHSAEGLGEPTVSITHKRNAGVVVTSLFLLAA